MQGKQIRQRGSFFIYYFLAISCMALYNAFFPLFFQEVGMNASELGLLFGLAPLVSLFCQPMWGYLADTARYKNYVLWGIFGGLIVLSLVFPKVQSLVVLSGLFIVFTAFLNSVAPLHDAITLDYLRKYGGQYTYICMMGSAGYAATSFVAGQVLHGKADAFFSVYLVVLVLVFAVSLTLPKAPGYREKKQKTSILAVLKNRSLLLVLLMAFVLYTGISFYFTYFGPYMMALGGNYSLYGIAVAIQSLAEFPFYIKGFNWRVVEKFGIGKILIVAMGIQALRFVLIGTATSPIALVFIAPLHGAVLVPLITSVVEYVNDHVPPEHKASGQMTMTLFTLVLCRVLANILGGAVVQRVTNAGGDGMRMVFLALAPLTLIFGLWIGRSFLKREKAEKSIKQ